MESAGTTHAYNERRQDVEKDFHYEKMLHEAILHCVRATLVQLIMRLL